MLEKRMKERLFVAAFWAAGAFALVMALLPHPPQLVENTNDKLQHVAAFVTLSVLASLAYPRAGLMRIGLALSAYGAAIEVLQAIPVLHRDCDFWDWVTDTAAILVALGLVQIVRRLRRSRDSLETPQ